MRGGGARAVIVAIEAWRSVASVVALGMLSALATTPSGAFSLTPAVSQMYTSVSVSPPSPGRMVVCYGFGCDRRYVLDFTPADRKALTAIMSAGRASADAERKAAANAVVWFDRRIGSVIGTSQRVARADFRHFAASRNFDCFDTTRNTTSLLLIMQDWGLFRHHEVSDPRYRGNFLVGQTPHNTAILREKSSRRDWVVDMWPKAYAELPDVMPIETWLKQD